MKRWPWSRVDLGGRPALVYKDRVKVRLVGDLQTELVEDFFGGFVNHAGANLHAKVLYGRSNHHKIEAIFKCFARAMRYACSKDERLKDQLPSTKGLLDDHDSRLRRGQPALRRKTRWPRSAPPYEVVRDAASLARATKIILPGVGHFGQMMRALDALQVRDALIERIRAGVPFLGICLGLQALFERSEEAPECAAASRCFPERFAAFAADARCPHMGWNNLERANPTRVLFAASPRARIVYFAHSYYAPVVAATAATCTYTVPYTAVLECGQHLRRAVSSRKIRAARPAHREEFRGALMLAKRIIPCLDVTAGRVVKGVNFVNLRDAGDPVELAERYNDQGADELVFLDITASSDARDTMADVVARTARKVFIPLTVGGGIRIGGRRAVRCCCPARTR